MRLATPLSCFALAAFHAAIANSSYLEGTAVNNAIAEDSRSISATIGSRYSSTQARGATSPNLIGTPPPPPSTAGPESTTPSAGRQRIFGEGTIDDQVLRCVRMHPFPVSNADPLERSYVEMSLCRDAVTGKR